MAKKTFAPQTKSTHILAQGVVLLILYQGWLTDCLGPSANARQGHYKCYFFALEYGQDMTGELAMTWAFQTFGERIGDLTLPLAGDLTIEEMPSPANLLVREPEFIDEGPWADEVPWMIWAPPPVAP